jgi:antitoxin VapB
MALSIEDPKTEQLALELASQTGESLTNAIRRALEERLKRLGRRGARQAELQDELAAIRGRVRALPVLDARSPDDILGYGPDELAG